MSVNIFLCHGKMLYLDFLRKLLLWYQGKTTRIKMISTQGYISSLRILVSPQNGLLHIGSLLTSWNFKPDLTGKIKLHLWSLKVSRSCECLLVSPMKLELWQFFKRNTSHVDKTVFYCTESVNPEVFGLSYFAINPRSEITKDLHFACSSSHKWCVTYVFVQYFCQARIFTFTFARHR